jgi:ubiquinone/menaquinone biosynthesis C-methylase UbiE
MIPYTISPNQARRFYNWLGVRHDLGARYERKAKARALALLDARPRERILNAGAGTGKEQRLLQTAVHPAGAVVAFDIARTMLEITRERNPQALLCEGELPDLPFAAGSFDAILCTYVLDLLPLPLIPRVLAAFRRVLRKDGRLVLVSLTTGVTPASKAIVGLWEFAYRIHPFTCGGCRPLQLAPLLIAAGFRQLHHEVVVQMGVPSEIISAAA